MNQQCFFAGCIFLAVVAERPSSAGEFGSPWSVRIVFGTEDKEPTDWSGRIVGPADVLDRIELEAWRFAPGQGDALQPKQKSWKVQTRLGIAPLQRQPVQGANNPAAKQVPWPVGVTVIGRGPEPARLEVETAQGNFEINVRELRWGVVSRPAASVRAERTPAPTAVVARGDDSAAHDDYPALLNTRAGERWLAFVSFERDADQVLVSRWQAQRWSEPQVLSPPGDHDGVVLAEDGAGHIWALWSQRIEGDWDLFARFWNGKTWSQRVRITNDAGPDIHPALESRPDGSVVLAWQGFHHSKSDVFVRTLVDAAGKLTDEPAEIFSPSQENAWMPALASDFQGVVHCACDIYRSGNYDVELSSQGGRTSRSRIIAATPLFETQPSIACDARDRVWVAYDEGTAAWGKDYGFWWWIDKWPQGTRLYEQRRFRVHVLDGDKRMEPPDPFASLPAEFQEFSEQPMMRIDGRGTPWVFFRHRTAKTPRADGWAAGGWWELYAIYLDGDRWSEPIPFPRSMGRQSQPSAVATTKDGLAVAWVTDGRSLQQPADGIRTRLSTGLIDLDHVGPRGSTPQPPLLRPYSPPDLTGLTVKNVHADEPGDVRRIRDYSVTVGNKKLHIYRGDLHRHTEISGDGVGDGTLTDLYRYALDAAAMDYIMVTDHGMGADRDYPWWRTQKSNDLYYVAGRFVPMYGYERSIKYPWGHRNVIWTERGHKTLPATKAKSKDEPAKKVGGAAQPADDDTEQLYSYLRKTGGIATLHTSASDQGTNWETGFNPELEPFVEIFQGYHTSYEGLGTPLAIDDRTAIVHGPYRPAGFVWNALDKGYRLGFQSSSDHIATHTSYACIWAESLDRRALVDGMKKRHSYAATDNIVLDVRSGDHMMGDEFTAAGPITLDVNILGTAPLARAEIIRNKEVVFSHDGNDSATARFQWTDMQPVAGTSYYYVRVQQTDRQMAWGSPMWVSRK